MKIIISPARRMKADLDSLPYHNLPQYLDKTKEILSWMRSLDYQELHKLWRNCSERIARTNYQRVLEMDLHNNLTPAVLAFQGLQYQYIGAGVMTERDLEYLEDNLQILSGFYGILRPFDGISLYRLGIGDRASVAGTKSLYEYWGDLLYQDLYSKNNLVINLASKEYSQAITPYLQEEDQFITCIFGEMINGKIKQKATLAKMARGNMVRYLTENQIQDIEGVKKFSVGGYRFREDLSNDNRLYFELTK